MAAILKVRARVRGERQVRRNLEELARVLDGKDMSAALLAGARVYAKRMKALAPRRSGKLQDGIFAFSKYESDQASGRKVRLKLKDNEAMAISNAPHSHLVEFGSKGKRITTPKKGKAIRLPDGRILAKVDSGRMPAHPFWRPTVYQGANTAQAAVHTAVLRLVGKYD